MTNLKEIQDVLQNQTKQYYAAEQFEVAAPMAFLIGTKNEYLYARYIEAKTILNALQKNDNAMIIRALCKIRTNLMLNYQVTENDLVCNMKNLPYQNLYKDDIKILRDRNADITHVNYKVNMYLAYINEELQKRINSVKDCFPEWVNWDYLRPLFIMPNTKDLALLKAESQKYLHNKSKYPFSMYINWQPKEYGNILYNDEKFTKILYSIYDDDFNDLSKVRDASEDTKTNIYDFIDVNPSVALVVDCENSDAFKLAAMIKQLDKESFEKIEKIMLYDDEHTTSAWKYIGQYTNIPVEYHEIERVKTDKSLVDIRMAMGISKAYYKENIDAFILLSSDSDFWGVISSLPEANFMVCLEHDKTSHTIIDKLKQNNIMFCSIDDFSTSNINQFKNQILRSELVERIGNLIDIDGVALTESLFQDVRLPADKHEKNNFFRKYIKTLNLACDNDNHLKIQIAN